ncbi:hypothetical protein SCLCIDRAFT_48836, partial [Scleroderma citrinum Foug A]
IPDQSTERLYNSWRSLIPTLIEPLLEYTSRTLGKHLPPLLSTISFCKKCDCERRTARILCLLFDCERFL